MKKDNEDLFEDLFSDIFDDNESFNELDLASDLESELLNPSPTYTVKTPEEIKAYLDRHVASQERAKKVLSVACYNHMQRCAKQEELKKIGILPQKHNVLLLGPSGCGKTYLVQRMAEIMEVPYIIIDSTTLVQSGFKGINPEEIISMLYDVAGRDERKTSHGIIFLDEIDKKAHKSYWDGGEDHVGTGVQQCLLKMLEDGKVTLHNYVNPVTIDTSNILFVAGGAFPGIERIIEARLQPKDKRKIGFDQTLKNQEDVKKEKLLKQVKACDIIKYGFLPEFVGRFPVIAALDELTEDDLYHILTEVDNNLVEQYKALMIFDGIKLNFEEEALRVIVAKAKSYGCGARSLRSIMEKLLLYPMYSAPSLSNRRRVVLTITKLIAEKGVCAPMRQKRPKQSSGSQQNV